MRTILWLTMLVFISTLYWPQLLNDTGIIYCMLLSLFLIAIPGIKRLTVIPVTAIYFTFYANLTLTGSIPLLADNISSSFSNPTSLQAFVDGENHDVIVQVNSLINQKNNGYFTAKLIELDNNHLNYSPRIEMRWYKPNIQLQSGQLHRFSVRLKPVYGRANPAGFDRQKWQFSEHIAYQASIKEHIEVVSPRSSLRAIFYQKVSTLSASFANQGIILALSFADKSMINSDKKEVIKKLGISHLFAISGLHIGLLFSFVYLLVHLLVTRLLPCGYLGWFSWRLVNFIALSVAFFYAYLAGFSLPTQRAFVMLLIAVFVFSIKRRCALVDLILLTLFIILILDPLAVLSAGLWLSFFAVSIILVMLWRFPGIKMAHNTEPIKAPVIAVSRYIKILFLIQISLTILMIPMQLVYFSAFNGLSPLVNFIAVPIFSLVIIPFILLGCLFSTFLQPVAQLCFFVADYLITLFFHIFTIFERGYQLYSSAFSWVVTLFIVLSVVVYIIVYQAKNNRTISIVFVLLVFAFQGVAVWENKRKMLDSWFIEIFDVGQGLAVLIRSEGKTLLYDTGPRYQSGFNTATSEITPYLRAMGIDQLDYFVISHSDIDHAGGFEVIRDTFFPKKILLGEPLVNDPKNSAGYPFCIKGQHWQLGALDVEVLSPKFRSKNNNDNSCVLRINGDEISLLLTGDIGKKQEKILIKEGKEALASDVLIAPHHGSKHSSTQAFIKAVSPQWVVFSAGFMNRWNFPTVETKLRYKNQGVKMVTTGISGFIRYKIEKGQINMQSYREDLAAYWYHHSFSL